MNAVFRRRDIGHRQGAMIIPNYEIIQELSASEWNVLFRGRRLEDHMPVLLKTRRLNTRNTVDAELLEREFETLGTLSLERLVRAYDLLRFDGLTCLVLEDPGGSPLQVFLASHSGDLDFFFGVATRLSAIISELHRNGIIHRYINPRSILVDPASGEVWLTDLSLAVRSSGETQAAIPPRLLRGALAYSSPELTGRMNRSTDYRTDFYSLGVTLYELLTGRLPFWSTDALELIHSHIAKTPLAPSELDPNIPGPLSQIIMKLLAKTAEDRYQSALGLKEDLEVCARDWAALGTVTPFTLAQRDVSDRFLISQKLYGREQEVEELLGAFDHVCQGHAAMMVVAGYSGIGKTSLIQELYKPIVRERGYFISGKFDQVARSVPFGALIQAFHGLVRQLLTESEERLAQWRTRLSQALGTNAGVLAEVIPEIELIIGKQPPALALGPTEALNRFQMVFQNFVAALASQEHPLVVFLDDLQWADPATLSLFQPVLTSPSIQYLFLMGAYRDNEVDASHPLTRTLGVLESAGVELRRIMLGSLQLPDLTCFIRDTLRGDLEEAAPLVDLVWEKTNGNPFFVIQFLKTLKQEGFLEFDYDRACWAYRIDDIAGAAMTDNVIDLMTRKIQRLARKTQRALTLASCIGNLFDRETLAIISEQTAENVEDDLHEAIQEGLVLPDADGESRIADCGLRIDPSNSNSHPDYTISGNPQSAIPSSDIPHSPIPSSDIPQSAIRNPQFPPIRNPQFPSFTFLHDRVQQAAYALIPTEEKQIVHLTVGRLMLGRANSEQIDEKLFDIVQHMNRGSGLIVESAERVELARLNLRAGRRAKSSTAYEAALDYFKAGVDFLSEEQWASDYDLAFSLHIELAECQNLCGNFDDAEREFELLLEQAKTSLDKARVHSLRIVHYEKLSVYAGALASGREGLALFGVRFPESTEEKRAALEHEVGSIQSLLDGRSIASLIDLPVMTDPEIRMVMNILTTIWSPAYIFGDQILTRLISATMVRLSLIHGNSEESAYGYATHAITVGPLREDYKAAYEFGSLALQVNQRFNDSSRRAKICQQFQAHAIPWRRPLRECIPYAQEARRSGFETGDFTYAIYGAYTETWVAIVITQNLARFVRDYSPNLALFKKLKVASVGDAQKVLLNWARALQGQTNTPVSLSDEEFDEDDYVATYRANPFFLICYAVTKMQLLYLFGEYGKALEAARMGREIIHHLEGTIWIPVFDFWNGLTLAANYAQAGEDGRRSYFEEIDKARLSFAVLAENCPENYLCQSLLLDAEFAKLAHLELIALDYYERALAYARETEMIQHEALANELLIRFWLARGQEKVAAVFLAEARSCYERWGATAKVEHLKQSYSDLLKHESADAKSRGWREPEVFSVDVATVTKAARAITEEIELEELLAKLLQISLENAGAERGTFLQEKDGQLVVAAEGAVGQKPLHRESLPLHNAAGLSKAVVRYVHKTGESVVIADAATDERFAGDPYLKMNQPKSILCVPIVHQGRSSGILYLENNLTTGAFTSERIEMMSILSATAAITIEKANLYDGMKQEAAYRRRAEETLREIVKGTASVTGAEFFRALVQHLALAIGVQYAFVTECADRTRTRLRTLAFWTGEGFAENTEYEVALTPCKKVAEGKICHYASELQQLFPGDTDLVALKAESYVGFPLIDSFGEVIGHLAVMDDKPVFDASGAMSVLQIFAARAAAELQRQQAEEELRRAYDQVEELKNRLHAENIYLQEEIRREHNFEEIVGNSPALLKVLADVERVAPTDSTVLVNGETGTGKELIARAIHDRSARRDHPLVKVNCGAISAGLVESELFGHVKGAFTGAFDKRVGRFELANGGSLFLDEVSELPLETQVKLLRVLQEGEFEPVGSSRTVRVNVRIIAATNRRLDDEVRAGRFRSDLFYRLNVFPVRVPALRERVSDIPQLVAFFLSRFAKRFGKKIEGVSQDTMEMLISYPWPGNVRELQNIIERGVVLAQGSIATLDPGLLRTSTASEPAAVASAVAAPGSMRPGEPTVAGKASPESPTSLEELERRHILNVLEQTGWVIEGTRGAARQLKLHPNTLRSRMKKLGIQRPAREKQLGTHEIP
jgi:predicted ATPase/tRNA A-37 threonylcarbamoyl transferase component Bud32